MVVFKKSIDRTAFAIEPLLSGQELERKVARTRRDKIHVASPEDTGCADHRIRRLNNHNNDLHNMTRYGSLSAVRCAHHINLRSWPY